ncbi:MAG: ATP synthase subunit I [Gammaproteobacteria bacterium]|nr:ATP synthase subunit I [Gammaproteobacteria bacterium]
MNAAKPSGSGRRWGTPVRIVALQAAVTVVVAALALAWSVDEAKSAFLGGLVALLPNAYFAWAASRAGRGGQDAAQEAVIEGGKFLGRWLVKMGLMVALLVVALGVLGAGSLGFFVGLVAALLAPLATPLVGGTTGVERGGSQPRD